MMKSETLYLDHAAAARPDPVGLEFYGALLRRVYVNQEAVHPAAFELRRELLRAAQKLAAAAGFPGWNVFFADSGTGVARLLSELPVPPGAVAVSGFEHPAVAAAVRRWNRPLHPISGDPSGISDKIGVAVATVVQSELGLMADWNTFPAAPLRIADAVQAAGKLPLAAIPADALLISGHKFGAPGGAALLYRPNSVWEKRLRELREREYLTPRPEPALALALAEIFVRRCADLEPRLAAMRAYNIELRGQLENLGLHCTVAPEAASPYILHLLAPGKQGAVLVRMLGELGILAASGSACQAEAGGPSPALAALGFRGADAYAGLRLSFDGPLDGGETARLVGALGKILRNY